MSVNFLFQVFVDVGVDDSGVSAGVHLPLEFVVLVDKTVQVVGQLLQFPR